MPALWSMALNDTLARQRYGHSTPALCIPALNDTLARQLCGLWLSIIHNDVPQLVLLLPFVFFARHDDRRRLWRHDLTFTVDVLACLCQRSVMPIVLTTHSQPAAFITFSFSFTGLSIQTQVLQKSITEINGADCYKPYVILITPPTGSLNAILTGR